jgi:hypothetical protein
MFCEWKNRPYQPGKRSITGRLSVFKKGMSPSPKYSHTQSLPIKIGASRPGGQGSPTRTLPFPLQDQHAGPSVVRGVFFNDLAPAAPSQDIPTQDTIGGKLIIAMIRNIPPELNA